MTKRLRISLTACWFASATVMLRYWDLTLRVEAFLVWTAVFICLYSAATALLRACDRGGPDGPWADVWLWTGILLAATAIQALFPRVAIGASTVQTVALFRVLDIVLPLWITLRGVYSVWGGLAGASVALVIPMYLLGCLWLLSVRMPGESYTGALPPLSPSEVQIRENARQHVAFLSDSVGSRGFRNHDRVVRTRAYLDTTLTRMGYRVDASRYVASDQEHENLHVTIPGSTAPDEIVIVGAHYDSYDLTPGADDNATGVAGVLEIARLMVGARPTRTVRLVFFGTEEPPFFNTDAMGSRVYASRAREAGERIVAMYSLEMLGYFTEEDGSQQHPPPLGLFFPNRGNFIAFVGNPASGRLLRRSLHRFRETTPFPSEGVVSSSMVPGVELSDHASFWRNGYPAVLVTDTGPFRNINYHLGADVSSSLDFDRMARVVAGVHRVVEDVARAGR